MSLLHSAAFGMLEKSSVRADGIDLMILSAFGVWLRVQNVGEIKFWFNVGLNSKSNSAALRSAMHKTFCRFVKANSTVGLVAAAASFAAYTIAVWAMTVAPFALCLCRCPARDLHPHWDGCCLGTR